MAAILSRPQCVNGIYFLCYVDAPLTLAPVTVWWIIPSRSHLYSIHLNTTLIARFMGPTWDPSGATGPRWAPCWPQELCYLGLRPRQDGHHFLDDILKCIFFNENIKISIKISLNCVHNGPISNIPALVQILARCRQGDKPLSETTMVSLLTHICVTRPQWINMWRSQIFRYS